MAETRMVVDPPKAVEVEYGGRWHPGHLSRWVHDGYGWRAWVRWRTGIGENRLGLVEAERVWPSVSDDADFQRQG